MQTNSHNATISVSQPTIIQVAKSNSTALLQNGQHLLIGKLGLDQNNTNSSVDNQSGSSSNNAMQAIYPLQYIETAVANANNSQSTNEGSNSNVYGSASNKIFYQDSHSTSIYTSMSGQTATIIPASSIQARDLTSQLAANVGSTVHIQGAQHAQIVHHGGNAYLVQSTGRIEDESPNLSHTTKASPVTVQWLCDNYETADGVSLPRSTLYNHYLQHCQQEKLEPMNQASFGKLIRSVFFGLRTRRLGTRGNSKYHYYGIRIKPNSVLNHYVEDQTFAMRQYPSFHRQSGDSDFHWRGTKYSSNGLNYGGIGAGSNASVITSSTTQAGGGTGGANNSSILIMNNNNGNGNTGTMGDNCNSGGGSNNQQHSTYLGESSSALPNLSDIISRAELDTLTEDDCLVEGITLDNINVFCQMYLDHSDAVLSAVVYLNFKYIETLWQEFWRTSVKPQSNHLEEKLSKMQLHRLLKIQQVQNFLQLFDNMFYQSLVEVLIPNVLRPIPSALTQNIRHFAKSLESWMAAAISGLNPEVVQIKMSCVCALAQTLRRHTSLNHLAQAARAVLKNASQISQMLTDLNRVDFTNVQEQASWVCGCDNKRVDALQQEFKRILQQQASLEEWATWLDHVVTDVLEPYKGTPQYPNAAHQFILKWSFYSSMVIRDLTLRSAASFGSFHLIRLLYDEYIYYLVEQKVADHLNLSPVAVTGEMGRQLMASDCANYGQMQVDDIDDSSATSNNNSIKPLHQLKFKIDHSGVKKETDSISSSIMKIGSGDYGGLMSYNTSGATAGSGTNAVSGGRLVLTNNTNLPSSVASGPLEPNSQGSSVLNYHHHHHNSSLTDDQVDESADDDEGLDEDFQTGEPTIQLSQLQHQQQPDIKTSVSAPSTVIITAVPIKKPDSAATNTVQLSANRPTTTTVSSASTGGARKTVNVTTFGEPIPSSTATTLTTVTNSSTATNNSAPTDIPLTASNKINIVSNSTSGIVALPVSALKSSPTIVHSNTKIVIASTPNVTELVPPPTSSTSSSTPSSNNISMALSSSLVTGGAPANKRIKLVNNNNNCSTSAASVTVAAVTNSNTSGVTGSSSM